MAYLDSGGFWRDESMLADAAAILPMRRAARRPNYAVVSTLAHAIVAGSAQRQHIVVCVDAISPHSDVAHLHDYKRLK